MRLIRFAVILTFSNQIMNEEIRALEPAAVWSNFADLNAVPRASKKEEEVISFMLDFGKKLNLETFKDQVGNVIIRKPGTNGMEDKRMITLQSHLDMVHQKNSDTDFDFATQGIEMYLDGEWVRARGTTLGADNGMGVAAIMALLQSEDIPHPPLEALFTIDEETGMTGAMGLEAEVLQGSMLLNLDTEEDDEIDIGCAGGIDISAQRTYRQIPVKENETVFEISVSGLQGGHSGMDIHRGFGNANKIMNRLLYQGHESFGMAVSSIDGGGLRNAIPRESRASVVISKDEQSRFNDHFHNWADVIKAELSVNEPQLTIKLSPQKTTEHKMDPSDQEQLLKSIYGIHNGVYAMSASIPDLVETSNNLARVLVKDGKIEVMCLTRSSVDTAKMDLAYGLRSVLELAAFEVEFSGAYPGWNPNPDSEILRVLEERYQALFNQKPKVVACHAGLECGILGQNYPDMDMISFGPTIRGAHSPDERVSVGSVQKFWGFLVDILAHIP